MVLFHPHSSSCLNGVFLMHGEFHEALSESRIRMPNTRLMGGLNQTLTCCWLEVCHSFPTAPVVVVQPDSMQIYYLLLARMMIRRLPSLLRYYYPQSSMLPLSIGQVLMNKCAGKGVT
jgi:hypothetical protein